MCECASQFTELINVNNGILTELKLINQKITDEHILSRINETNEHILTRDRMGLDNQLKPADIMVQEYLHGKDLDENGKIYGFDFVVENPPPILKTITSNVLSENPNIRIDPELE
ncbi:MAG: hypothetical protein H8D97_00965 [Proteobacteria bacterium]|nr:hypothetical protein [Pseudomonadota bacterium]